MKRPVVVESLVFEEQSKCCANFFCDGFDHDAGHFHYRNRPRLLRVVMDLGSRIHAGHGFASGWEGYGFHDGSYDAAPSCWSCDPISPHGHGSVPERIPRSRFDEKALDLMRKSGACEAMPRASE
jgi:hypothetical protein